MLIEKQCTKNKTGVEEQEQAQKAEKDKRNGKHLSTLTELGAVGRGPFRISGISSSASLEETPWDTISKEKYQQIKAKTLPIKKQNDKFTIIYIKIICPCANLGKQ